MTKTITIIILGIALIIAILDDLCIIKVLHSDCTQLDSLITTVNSHCDDTQRYDVSDTSGGGISKTLNDATGMVASFYLPTTISNKGAAISKEAIDMMFDKSGRANTLVCYFVNNAADPSQIDLVFEVAANEGNRIAVQASPNAAGRMITNNEQATGSGDIFLSQGVCPSICGLINPL